jgi:hypothetical protein
MWTMGSGTTTATSWMTTQIDWDGVGWCSVVTRSCWLTEVLSFSVPAQNS